MGSTVTITKTKSSNGPANAATKQLGEIHRWTWPGTHGKRINHALFKGDSGSVLYASSMPAESLPYLLYLP